MTTDWRDHAACKDPKLGDVSERNAIFYPDESGRGRAAAERPAKAICRSCPVKWQCRMEAITAGDHYGIQGGMNSRERIDWATTNGIKVGTAPGSRVEHGTMPGYRWHQKVREPICRACSQANAARVRKQDEKRRLAVVG